MGEAYAISEKLQGSVRQPGVHACGILISRDPLIDSLPIMPTEGESLMNTQYDGHFVEPIGLLKMDFLGLKTLTVFKECLATIKEVRGEEVDLSSIPLDDPATFRVFQRGDTTGLFQFESDGMKKNLRELRPTRFEDLVAMNALYRPGPMAYIPQFINRKHGREPIQYDHPLMEEYLAETYGVTVYQEQVMLLSRSMGGFTRGESDTLRKAMGKKQLDTMEKLHAKFREGCLANPRFMDPAPVKGDRDAAERLIDKIWNDWRAFASYAFNKSHAVCYAYVAYQTGWLKAHYPAEYMCAQISSEIGNFDKMPVFIAEAAEMDYRILPPDVNRSSTRFTPEPLKDGAGYGIRYGLAGIPPPSRSSRSAGKAAPSRASTTSSPASTSPSTRRRSSRSCSAARSTASATTAPRSSRSCPAPWPAPRATAATARAARPRSSTCSAPPPAAAATARTPGATRRSAAPTPPRRRCRCSSSSSRRRRSWASTSPASTPSRTGSTSSRASSPSRRS